MDDADDENAERADVHAPPEGDGDDDASWPVLSDLDLAVCLVDSVPMDVRAPLRPTRPV